MLDAMDTCHRIYSANTALFKNACDARLLVTRGMHACNALHVICPITMLSESCQLQDLLDKHIPTLRLIARGFIEKGEAEYVNAHVYP